MYTKILVPLDGSPLAQQALSYTKSLAKIPAEGVIDPMSHISSLVAKSRFYCGVLSAEKQKGSGYLKKAARFFLNSLTVDSSVEVGNPAEVIVRKAAAGAGTLIAMVTHGRSGVKRWFLGSVTEKVLHMTAHPLFVVRAKT